MKKEKPIQYFSDEYLKQCAKLAPEQIIEFLENYRELMYNLPEKCQLISLKIEPSLLKAFKHKANLLNIPYQTQIKQLMRNWILNGQDGKKRPFG